MSKTVKIFDYLRALVAIRPEIDEAINRVLHSGKLILGPESVAFESEFTNFTDAIGCVGVSSGTTAIHLALMALGVGVGDEVITVSNTCAPTVAGICLTGASPVLVDVDSNTLMLDSSLLERVLTERTKCIVPVHLWGHAVDMDPVMDFASRHQLLVVEDCAQAHGTTYKGRHVGLYGHAGCFSFYPTKNIGAYGEAGAIISRDMNVLDTIREERMYGYRGDGVSHTCGMNARISELQAAILRVKLQHYPESLARRRSIASFYDDGLSQASGVKRPVVLEDTLASYHQYVICCDDRDRLLKALSEHSIEYGIHYPVPIHQMPAYADIKRTTMEVCDRAANEILSLPVHEMLTDQEVERVVRALSSGLTGGYDRINVNI